MSSSDFRGVSGFGRRRKWQPNPVFLPGEFQGRGAWWAMVYGITVSDMAEHTAHGFGMALCRLFFFNV